MDVASDSSDTIILSLNDDEPSDTEVENILKKYSSNSGTNKCKEGMSPEVKVYDLNESSDEDIIDIPLIKRARKNGANAKDSTKQNNGFSHEKKEYDDPDNYEMITFDEFECGFSKNCDKGNDILKRLHKKYSVSATNENKWMENNIVVLSDSSDSNDSTTHVCPDKFPPAEASLNTYKENNEVMFRHSSEDDVSEGLEELSPKTTAKARKQREIDKKRNNRAREKKKKQEEAEKKKAMKNIEKERKKEMVEQQKALKNALKSAERSTKPDECIKQMIVEIDDEISQKEYGEVLKTVLNNNDISFKSKAQVFPKLVSWRRKLQTIENMILKNSEVSEKYFLLLLDTHEFSHHIRNNSLTLEIQKVSSMTQSKHVTVGIFGMDKAKGDQDFAIIEAQMFSKCYFRFVKKNEDLAALVMELTKAVAQIPYKLKKEEKYMLQSEYFNDSNKDTVRVDKNGNGLGRLWHQMLTMFPLARLETAEAITAAYPTPSSLFKAYHECESIKEELLQNLPIRRALGPCTSVRRIGPELSRKCFNFFCSTENLLLLLENFSQLVLFPAPSYIFSALRRYRMRNRKQHLSSS